MIKQNGHECVMDENKLRRIIDVETHESLIQAERDLNNTKATLLINYAEKNGRCKDDVRLTDNDAKQSTVSMLVLVLQQYSSKLRVANESLQKFADAERNARIEADAESLKKFDALYLGKFEEGED